MTTGRIKRFFSALTLLICCSTVFAYEPFEFKTYTQVITVSGGLSWARAGKTQTMYSSNSSFTYEADDKITTMGAGELFLGLQWPFNDCINNQLGIAFGGAGVAHLQGTVTVNSIPTGSSYEYKVGHGMVTARGKMIASPQLARYVQPYITGSVGAGYNQAFGFRTYPLVNAATSSQWFHNKTYSFVLTYSVGLGVQKNLNDNWNIGVGYEFADWGTNGLGPAITTPWTYSGPQLTTLYTHNLMLSLTYLC